MNPKGMQIFDVCALLFCFLTGVALLSAHIASAKSADADVYMSSSAVVASKVTIVATLPAKTDESRLLRVVDRKNGVVCYIIQNDTADFHSGLQCFQVHPSWLEKSDGSQTDK